MHDHSSIKEFDTSCFSGHYVTGDVTPEYLARLQSERSDMAKASRRDGDKNALRVVKTLRPYAGARPALHERAAILLELFDAALRAVDGRACVERDSCVTPNSSARRGVRRRQGGERHGARRARRARRSSRAHAGRHQGRSCRSRSSRAMPRVTAARERASRARRAQPRGRRRARIARRAPAERRPAGVPGFRAAARASSRLLRDGVSLGDLRALNERGLAAAGTSRS